MLRDAENAFNASITPISQAATRRVGPGSKLNNRQAATARRFFGVQDLGLSPVSLAN